MLPSHEKILNLLKQFPLSMNSLCQITGYSKDGIRGRISELRHRYGYNIENTDGRYVLKKNNEKKIINYIEKNNLYGVLLTPKQLSEKLNMSENEVLNGLVDLIEKKQVMQQPKNRFYIVR